MTSKLLLAAIAGAAVLPSAAQAQRVPAAAVVVIDTDRIYRECTACRAAVAQLQTQAQSLQSRQQALAAPLTTEGQQIQTAVNALNGRQPDAALRTRIQAFETRREQAAQEVGRLQQNIQSTQVNVRRQIDARMEPIINQVMTARGANVAVDTNATLAASTGINVTNDVLARLNQQLPSVSVTPLPQNQQQQTQGR
uniref:OmpH family outer membrane protein n=1 Tax=uncultured Sphingomonas sp. TaxID=158754 RepID=UPI0025DA54E5|nr:OmpH family outer membrane protein [uncultured Sphingomonas sp.]